MNVELVDRRGKYRVVSLGRGVVWFEFEGFVQGAWWSPSEALLERAIAEHGRVTMLGNGYHWDGYEPAYRAGVMSWFSRRRGAIAAVHLLTRSRIVHMGAQVVNLAIPIITTYRDLPAFMVQATQVVPALPTVLRQHGLTPRE